MRQLGVGNRLSLEMARACSAWCLAVVLGMFAVLAPAHRAAASPPPGWHEAPSDHRPAPRSGHVMVYDQARGAVVLFGGAVAETPGGLDDLWTWNGRDWTELRVDARPPGRARAAAAYDTDRERLVVFGGASEEILRDDTWEWDGARWAPVTPSTRPAALDAPTMAYDARRHATLLFGGVRASGEPISETWALADGDWHQLFPAASPPPRSHAAMAFHAATGTIVLHGGRAADGTPLGDTWEWDGSTWVDRSARMSPSARLRPAMAYDPDRQRILLFGGDNPAVGSLRDTWSWDGARWLEVATAPQPPARGDAAVAYDPQRGHMVVFGGATPAMRNDTWEYGTAPRAVVYLPMALGQGPWGTPAEPVRSVEPCDYASGGPASDERRPEIDLSAAHATIRFFGVNARYSIVDQALTAAFRSASDAAWPMDHTSQRSFLEVYAAALEGVCAVPVERAELGPARIEQNGSVAIVRPGTGEVRLPPGTSGVAVDLRGLPDVPELERAVRAAVAPALAYPVAGGSEAVRRHAGLTDEVISATNVYRNTVVVRERAPISATGAADLPLALLTDGKLAPAVADVAGSLRLARRAVLIGDDVPAAVAESLWLPVGDAYGLQARVRDLRSVEAPQPTIRFDDLRARQDDCGPWNNASVRRDFTTRESTARVTVRMTGIVGADSDTDLDLLVFYDRDADGELELWDDFMGGGAPQTEDHSLEVVVVDALLPAGRWEAWVLGCTVPNADTRADISIEIQPGSRWPDVIPADIHAADPLAAVRLGLAMVPELGPVAAPRPRRPEIAPVASYRDIQPDATGVAELRAGLVTLHGAYRRFFPYFDVVGDGIDDRLLETLALEPTDGLASRPWMLRTLRRMSEAVRDGHTFAYNYGSTWERFSIPIRLESVDGEPVVYQSGREDIRAGDTIVAIDGRPAADVYADELTRSGAATDLRRFEVASQYILQRVALTTLELRDTAGVTRTLAVTNAGVTTPLAGRHMRSSGWLDDLDAPDVYYLNVDQSVVTSIDLVREALTEATSARALVLDMRGYPVFNHYELARRLLFDAGRSAVFRVPSHDGPDRRSVDESGYDVPPLLDPHFHGPIVLLVGPHTLSAAENFSTILVGARRVTVIGRRSAGTNGNITGVQLPGAFAMTFTGMEVRYPDQRTFHGVGIVPDIEVTLRAEDFRDGVDRELTTAVEWLRAQ